MTDIAPIGGGLVGRALPVESTAESLAAARAGSAAPDARASRIARGADRVEVSRMASLLNQLRDMPEMREDLIRRVRDQIASGAYDTPERIEGAIDGILGEEAR